MGEDNDTIKTINDRPCPPPTRSSLDNESIGFQEEAPVTLLANEGSCRGNRLLDIDDLQCLIEEIIICKHCRSGSIRVTEKTVGIATKFKISCERCKKNQKSTTNVPNSRLQRYQNQQILT